ncbi:glycosyltransferase family 2 protein [Flavobacterium sp. KACC 22763]|uniref:glycosyltransferase family 2 protein n=1 Tax=Flavobacterium sp. KACC 22763 TaxID=3025668 RepID=UPI002366240F|nr:glycosyltransferase family A protein [Flavobacterium sp. KACC 22763]WDF62875.1 glycosyltransferase family A protein [Flavobacterium sp. KACC 22763]
MANPLVSIIVPCYSQALYLDEALQSVLVQTYVNWECIIVNDGSPDNTDEVAKIWLQKDTRFKYVFQENSGLSCARNFGISQAAGEFILPLDADDKIALNYTELAMRAFEQDRSLKVVYCKAEKFGIKNGLWELPPFSLERLTYDNMIFCSAFFKKSDWSLVGGYDSKMIYGLEDWEFWISILKNGGFVKRLEDVGFYYRIKPDSMLKRIDIEKKNLMLEYLSTKHLDFYIRFYGSFAALNYKLSEQREYFSSKLQSKKFVIDLFCSTFFGFSIFGAYKKEK